MVPFYTFTVVGKSMEPTIREGSTVLVLRFFFHFFPLKKNQLVVAKHPSSGRLLLKRIKQVEARKVFLLGDNKESSTDSRAFGWVDRRHLMGSVLVFF